MSTPPSPDPFSTSTTPSFNGYHLLNEVSTGGTLSSLFSILSLFTEDVKLSWSPDKAQETGAPLDEEEEDMEGPTGRPPGKSRTNSDVSQLDEETMGKDQDGSESGLPKSTPAPQLRSRSLSDTSPSRHRDSMSSAGDDATIRESNSDTNTEEEAEEGNTTFRATDFVMQDPNLPTPGASRRSSPASRRGRAHSFKPDTTRPPTANGHGHSRPGPKLGPTALNGTIARATVDTTLAVIPAEAFRKLTRKFPKASGTIVQVVLERFSRVTFMTGEF
jgi:lysophospholipid hydrolase